MQFYKKYILVLRKMVYDNNYYEIFKSGIHGDTNFMLFKIQLTKSRLPALSIYVMIISLLVSFVPASAATLEELTEAAEARKLLPIQTNNIENWPSGPAIGADSAILLEANTGVILYAKNIDKKQYPASTTKLMTALLAVENSSLNDMIYFSHEAVNSIESGSSNIGMDAGQALTLEQALYGIMVGSANEVANAIGEHVGGDMDAFADMMTAKASELGCKNTNFVNAHGLYHDNHYTTAYDMALIAGAFFRNELLTKISNTKSYHFTPTATQPDDFVKHNKHKLISGEIECDNVIGGKTGYTDICRQTLVTCAEKNGMKLICVILKEESPEQFNDTVKLFDYGFSNFQIVNVSENETSYIMENSSFFSTGNDVFGDSSPMLSLNKDSYLIMPKTTDFQSLTSEIAYLSDNDASIAEINYSYHGAFVGKATIDFATENRATYEFDHQIASVPADSSEIPVSSDAAESQFPEASENVSAIAGQEISNAARSSGDMSDSNEAGRIIFVNVKNVIFSILAVAAIAIIFFIIRAFIQSYHFNRRRYRRRNGRVRLFLRWIYGRRNTRKRKKKRRYSVKNLRF